MRIALVSAAAFRDMDWDLPVLTGALEALGVDVEVACWDDDAVDWSGYDLAVLRSVWDYIDRLPDFLAWLDRTSAACPVENDPALVRWNASKRYLGDLADAGVPVIPTWWPADGGDLPAAWDDVVVKPATSAGARTTARFAGDPDGARRYAAELLDAGHDVLVQPYVASVDVAGEIGLYVLDGAASHAVRKGAVLAPGAAPAADYALALGQEVVGVEVPEAAADFATRVLAALPGSAGGDRRPPLYARVDIVDVDGGDPRLLELEVIEPSLFLATTPGAADRAAAAIVRRAGAAASPPPG